MNDKIMDKINIILYYILAPVLVLEFFLSDMGIINFTAVLFGVSLAVLFVFIVIVVIYKRKHPDYEFKANEMYTRILVVAILLECFYNAGFFDF